MHSRIFEISESPIQKEFWIDESEFYESWFVGSIADYVMDSESRAYDIEWLGEDKGIEVGNDEHGDYIIITNKIEYFNDKFVEFRKELEWISEYKCNIEHFVEGFGNDMFHLNDMYKDKYGFYVYWNRSIGLETMDEFVRYADENVKYYIGGIVDYHW